MFRRGNLNSRENAKWEAKKVPFVVIIGCLAICEFEPGKPPTHSGMGLGHGFLRSTPRGICGCFYGKEIFRPEWTGRGSVRHGTGPECNSIQKAAFLGRLADASFGAN